MFSNLSYSEAWTVSGAPLDLHDPRLVAMAAAERHLLDAEYDEYADTNASGAAFCRSAALIVRHLLLERKLCLFVILIWKIELCSYPYGGERIKIEIKNSHKLLDSSYSFC